MAKILSVEQLKVPKHINIKDQISDNTVLTKVKYHSLDIKLEMEYCLHVFVYDNHEEHDAPLVIPNWDESYILTIALDRKDDFLLSPMKLKPKQMKRAMIFPQKS